MNKWFNAKGSYLQKRTRTKMENKHRLHSEGRKCGYALEEEEKIISIASSPLSTAPFQVQSNSNLLPIHSQMNDSKGMPATFGVCEIQLQASSITINIHIYVGNKITHSHPASCRKPHKMIVKTV